MRWLFWDPNNPEEAWEHARIDAAISQWWEWFAGIAEQVGQRHRTGARTPVGPPSAATSAKKPRDFRILDSHVSIHRA